MSQQVELFSPLSIRSTVLKNRIAVSPMCQYSSEDGFANDWHLVHLASRAVGGAGLVFTEATAVTLEGRISPSDLGIWKDDHIAKLSQITAAIKQNGAVPGMQLAHAGRKASTAVPWKGGHFLSPDQGGWQLVAPSPIPFLAGNPAPAELTREQIADIVRAFAAAAVRAIKAGFEILEIHGAHGYLIHEFLSPLANQRADEYGGSLENRIRVCVEVVKAIRAVIPEGMPLFLRISAQDWADGGWTVNESVELARTVKPLGVDLVDCSSGGTVPYAKIAAEPGFQVPFAERVRKETGVLTGAVGLITEPQQAEEILKHGKADIVLLARAFLRDPYWAIHAGKELGAVVKVPVQYERAF